MTIRARHCLGSLSAFLKHLKQPIARRANLEDRHTGHFLERRFYSDAPPGEEAVVAAIRKRQRAFGFIDDLKDLVGRHGYKRPVDAFPE